MIEVFKTDVGDPGQADMLIDRIQKTFLDYQVNFDLEDCDRILRVKSRKGSVRSTHLIGLLKEWGFNAELLPDIVRPASAKVLPAILSGFAERRSR
jgi:hypothetical protein